MHRAAINKLSTAQQGYICDVYKPRPPPPLPPPPRPPRGEKPENVDFTQIKFKSRQIAIKSPKKTRKFTWSSHRNLSVTQLTHVVYTTLLRITEFALHLGYSSPVKIQNGAEVGEFWAEDCDCNASFGD